MTGARGLWLVVPIAALLAAGAGGPEPSLLVLGPIVTSALPLVVMVAFWWEGWPGTHLRASRAGWADTLLIAAGGLVLTGAGQAVAGGLDAPGIFDPSPGPGHVPTFPATLPLAAAAFTVMLQLTLVGEGWPLRRLPARVAGLVALAASWAVALALYAALVEIAPRPGSGAASRSGPVPGADFGAALVWIGAWQVLWFVVWRGRPFSAIGARGVRLPCAHAAVLAAGLLSCLLARHAAEPATAAAAGGCVVAAGLTVGMLFEAQAGRPLDATVAVLVLAAALWAGLTTLGGAFRFGRAGPQDWVAHASLNALSVSIILHVAVGRRWPFGSVKRLIPGAARGITLAGRGGRGL